MYPGSIISDWDTIFLSSFLRTLFELKGTKLRMTTTAYHPQTEGQTEVVNRAVQQYLRAFVHENLSRWARFLHWAEWHYDIAPYSSTGYPPFFYGRPPPSTATYILGTSAK